MPIFDALSPPLQRALAEGASTTTLKRGQILWTKGDRAQFCVIPCEGLVEVYDSSHGGDERTIGLFGPGEMVGLSTLLAQKIHRSNAVASSPTVHLLRLKLLDLPEREFSLSQHRTWHYWLTHQILRHEQALRDKITILGGESLHFRLVELFDTFRLRLAKGGDRNNFKIPYGITKTQMSRIVEARVESVIRCLNRWERAGHLTMDDKGITVTEFQKLRTFKMEGEDA